MKTIRKLDGKYVLDITINPEFGNLLNSIDGEILKIEGLDRESMDFIKRKRDFSKANMSEFSLEGNSNVSNRKLYTIRSPEVFKGLDKLDNYLMLWEELKEDFGIEVANKCIKESIEGSLLIHDLTNGNGIDSPYCTVLLAKNIMLYGRPYYDVHSVPPKYFDSFMGQIIEHIIDGSSLYNGAIAISDLFIAMAYYTKKEKIEDKEIEQYFQHLIHIINNPYRKSGDSPFFNCSLLTKSGIITAFGSYEYPDGTLAIENVDEILRVQSVFATFFGKGIKNELGVYRPVAFPVVALNIVRENLDKEIDYVKSILKAFNKFLNLNIYVGSADKFASCCFDGSQKILAKTPIHGVIFKEISYLDTINKSNLKVFHNGKWVFAKYIKLNKADKKMYKVTTMNNKEIFVTDDHIHLTDSGNKNTEELSENDYLAFNKLSLRCVPEHDKKLTFEQGVLIGAYLEDGSKTKYQTTFSINDNKYRLLKPFLESALTSWGLDINFSISNRNNCLVLVYNSIDLVEEIKNYVNGDYCYDKSLNPNIMFQSEDFRKGIIHGLYLTDGGNSNRIYTTSEMLKDDLELLLTSLGEISIINLSDRTDEKVIIREEEYNRNYPLYCIRWYNSKTRNYKDLFKTINNTVFYKIKTIEEYTSNNSFVYCFEVENKEEPYFTLPNGIITHNCRLLNDMTKNNSINSFGSGALGEKIVGSLRVVSLNLWDIALETKNLFGNDKEKFFDVLNDKLSIGKDILISQRNLVKKRFEEGLHTFYNLNWIKLEDYYSTYGAGSIFEAVKVLFSKNPNTENDYTQEELEFAKRIPKFMEDYADKNSNNYMKLNVEFLTPLESGAKRLGSRIEHKYKIKDAFVSNQLLPLTKNTTIARRLEIENTIGGSTSAGGILHLNIEGEMPFNVNYTLIEKIVHNYPKIEFFALNKVSSFCKNKHLSFKNTNTCPLCGEEIIEKITRTIGYFKSVQNFSKPRQAEFEYRTWHDNINQYKFSMENKNEN